MELKELLGDDLYAKVDEKLQEHNNGEPNKQKHVRYADLSEGRYVSVEKYTEKETELAGVRQQLTDANKQIKSYKDMDIDGIRKSAADWEEKYKTDTTALQGKKEKNMRLLIMAGHGRNVDGSWDPGAVGNGYQEANLTRELIDLIKAAADRAGVPCDVAPDRNHYSYFKHGGTYDFSPYTYVLEIHFNASSKVDSAGDGQMKGSMVYIDKSETGHSVEDAILANLYALGSRQAWDGVVVTQRQESYKNGLMVQSKVRAQGVSHAVLETCFITDQDDMDWYLVNKTKIAQAIIAGIQQGFGLNYKKAITPYMVKVDVASIPDHVLNIRDQPSINSPVTGKITETMSLTIVDEASGTGASKWGKLKSGAGWISLDYTVR